jgi:hypothetical protein
MLFEGYVKWAQENGGMTESQIEEFKTLAHALGHDEPYGLDEFAEILFNYKTPAAEIIKSMKIGLAKRQSETK